MASAKRAVTRSSLPDGLGVRRDWVNMSSNHLSMIPYIIQSAKIRSLFGFSAWDREKIMFFVKKRGVEGENWEKICIFAG